MTEIRSILDERQGTHGDFSQNSSLSQQIKEVYKASPNWGKLTPWMKEALEMEAHKNGRILAGNFWTEDHWDDKAGYSTLVSDRIKKSDIIG